MRYFLLLTALVAASPAIAQTPEAAVEAPPTAPAEAPPTAPAEGGFHAEIQGRWAVVLTEQQIRDIAIMRVAVAEKPPTKKQLKALAMTEEEQVAFGMLAAMIQDLDPADPDLVMMRQVTAGAEQASIAFRDGQLVRAVPGLEISAPYVVLADAADSATIEFQAEGEAPKQWTMRRDGDALLAGAEGEAPMRYTRGAP